MQEASLDYYIEMPGNRVDRFGWTLLVMAALLPPWLLRAALIMRSGARSGLSDLRGMLADAGIGLLVAALLLLMARRKRWAGLPFIGLWSLLCYGNYEHVRVLGGNAAAVYADYLIDPTFLLGSALSASAPLLLTATVALPFILTWSGSRRPAPLRTALLIAATAAGALLLHIAWPARAAAHPWRQDNFVWENLKAPFTSSDITDSGDPRMAAGDLEGVPLIPPGDRGRNVLLVILEGLSGAYVAPLSSANDRDAVYDLPHLSRLAENNIFAGSFVTMQRQTNRGEYALLCGDYPKLVSEQPKMSELVDRPELRCLPAVLRDAGYATVYLQAAPLSFMMKDRFMPLIGYQQVHGEESFPRAGARNRWGVDDRTLFERGIAIVEELRAGGRPWFLTLLTVGTHHPYNVPIDFRGAAGSSDEERAFSFQDTAVGRFIDMLVASGALADTLVLFVSDESAGVARDVDDLTRLLTQAWGYFAAITPGGDRMRLEQPILQADVPLSVLDYLGLGDTGGRFAGRSLFRSYRVPRPIGFGNTFLRSVGWFDGAGRLVVCREDLSGCLAYLTAGRRPFAAGIEPAGPAADAEVGFLRGLIARSRISPPAGAGTAPPPGSKEAVVLKLIAAEQFAVRSGVYGPQLVAGGQNLVIGPSTRLEVSLDITVLGSGGQVVLIHELSAEGRAGRRSLHREESSLLSPGDRFRLRYHYFFEHRSSGLDCELFVNAIDAGDLTLQIGRATLSAAPAAADREANGPFGLDLREVSPPR